MQSHDLEIVLGTTADAPVGDLVIALTRHEPGHNVGVTVGEVGGNQQSLLFGVDRVHLQDRRGLRASVYAFGRFPERPLSVDKT